MVTVEEKISFFCEKTQYWEKIESNLIKSLGCEIQGIVYTDNCVILKLTPTNEQILMLFEYYRKTPNEFHLWEITMEIKTPEGISKFKVCTLDKENLNSGKHESALKEVMSLATPICIDSN